MKSARNKIKFQIAILIILIAISLLAIAITASRPTPPISVDSFNYRIVEVSGMTCVQWGSPLSYKGGLTCNWDEWQDNAKLQPAK